jgi:hypothetical protein
MSANLSSSNINAQFQSNNVKRQRGNDQSRFVDSSSTPLKRPYNSASKDASIFRTVASEGYADKPNSPDVQDLGKHVGTNEDDEILKNLDIESTVHNLRKFCKMIKMINKSNEQTDGNNSNNLQLDNNNHRNNSDNNSLNNHRVGSRNDNARNNRYHSNHRESKDNRIERSQSTPRIHRNDYYENVQNYQKQGNPSQNFPRVRRRERDDSRDRLRHNYTHHGRDKV